MVTFVFVESESSWGNRTAMGQSPPLNFDRMHCALPEPLVHMNPG